MIVLIIILTLRFVQMAKVFWVFWTGLSCPDATRTVTLVPFPIPKELSTVSPPVRKDILIAPSCLVSILVDFLASARVANLKMTALKFSSVETRTLLGDSPLVTVFLSQSHLPLRQHWLLPMHQPQPFQPMNLSLIPHWPPRLFPLRNPRYSSHCISELITRNRLATLHLGV